MLPNIYIVLLAAVVPLVIGAFYYSNGLLGKIWMKEANMSPGQIEGAKMGVLFLTAYIFAVLLAFGLFFIVVHQTHLFSVTMNHEGAFDELMKTYGNEFRTFKHGAFHGAVDALLIALPVLGTNALFERKSAKYIILNVGYWVISIAVMGGMLCAWA